jgi:hypothetical protein
MEYGAGLAMFEVFTRVVREKIYTCLKTGKATKERRISCWCQWSQDTLIIL